MSNINTYQIFKESNCISKELLTGYHHNTLSEKDKLAVETHLIDCELCSEALEGVAVMTSMEGMDDTIESVKNLSGKKAAIIKQHTFKNTLLAAASVAALLLFGAVVFNMLQKDLPQNEVAQQVSLPEQKMENSRTEMIEPVVASDSAPVVIMQGALSKADAASISREETKVNLKEADAIVSAQDLSKDLNEYKDQRESTQPADEAVSQPVEEISAATQAGNAAPPQTIQSQAAQKYSLPSNRVSNNDMQMDADKNFTLASATNSNVINVEGLRVFDYANEYTETKKLERVENGVEAKYPDKKSKALEKSAAEKETVALTYSDALNTALRSFNNKQYQQALTSFSIITKKHPQNVNAIFYSALCFEQMGNYSNALNQLDLLERAPNKTFDQEAQWHRALVYEKAGDVIEAKALYAKIVSANGFYKNQAVEKLKGLK